MDLNDFFYFVQVVDRAVLEGRDDPRHDARLPVDPPARDGGVHQKEHRVGLHRAVHVDLLLSPRTSQRPGVSPAARAMQDAVVVRELGDALRAPAPIEVGGRRVRREIDVGGAGVWRVGLCDEAV